MRVNWPEFWVLLLFTGTDGIWWGTYVNGSIGWWYAELMIVKFGCNWEQNYKSAFMVNVSI